MGVAAQQVLPIALTAEYRGDSAFRSLRTDISGARQAIGQWRGDLGRAANDVGVAVTAMQARINAATGVTARAGNESVSAFLRQGQELDALRAKYSPLFAAQQEYKRTLQEIGVAAKMGALTEKERAEAVTNTKVAFVQQVNALRGVRDGLDQTTKANHQVAASTGLARHEVVNLSRQVQDVGVSLASGQSPFLVLVQQGTQIADIFASSGGTVRGFLRQTASWLGTILTPARLVTGAVAGIGIAAAVSASQFGAAQRQIDQALAGIGKASGVSASAINRVASRNAGGLSTSEAREFATQLAATGRIGEDMLGPLVGIGKNIATIYGEDIPAAGKRLAEAFADPAKGAEELNRRLGFLDAASQRQIVNLTAQGRLLEAQQLLYQKTAGSVAGVEKTIATSTHLWTAFGNAMSNAWDKFGEVVSKATGIGYVEGLQDRIARLKSQIEQIEARPSTAGRTVAQVNAKLAEQRAQLAQATAEWNRHIAAQEAAAARQKTFARADAIDQLLPELKEADTIRNRLNLLVDTMLQVQLSADPQAEALKRTGRTYDELALAIDRANAANNGFRTSSQRAVDDLNLQIESIGKRSPSALGDLAYRRTLMGLGQKSGEESAEGKQQAELSRTLAIRQVTQQIADTQRDQLLSAAQRVETAKQELNIAGASGAEQERQRAIMQARHSLEQEALRLYGNREAYDRKHLEALTEQINREAAIKSSLAEQNALREAKFERSQIGRTPEEQQVAWSLRSVYGDDYEAQMDSALATQLRVNQALSQTKELATGVFKGMVNDIRQGKDAAEVFASALNKIADKLIDMAVNDLVGAAFGGSGRGGGFGGTGSIFSSMFGFGGGGGGFSTGSIGGTGLPGFGGFYAEGGLLGAGKWGIAGENGPEPIIGPAQVIPNHKLGGGSEVKVNVMVNNFGSSDVQVGEPKSDGRGGMNIEVVVGKAAAAQVSKPGSALDKALSNRNQLVKRY